MRNGSASACPMGRASKVSEVVRIPVGAGTPEGVNSAYVLPEYRTVVDPGPSAEEGWEALTSGITGSGLAVDDIEHVMVTHWHADHAGWACRLAERADAELHLHADDAPLVGDYAAARARRLDRDAAMLTQWGVPSAVRQKLTERDRPSPLPETFPVTEHADGDRIAGVEVIHTPGHTKGHISLSIEGTVFLGDLLLPTYTPNVGGSDTRLHDPLGTYLTSLERLEDRIGNRIERANGAPGHGSTMNIPDAISAVRRHHRERAKRTYRVVERLEEPTAWTVAYELFGEMTGIHAKFGAGEATAHLNRLAELRIVAREIKEPVTYRVVDNYPTGVNLTP